MLFALSICQFSITLNQGRLYEEEHICFLSLRRATADTQRVQCQCSRHRGDHRHRRSPDDTGRASIHPWCHSRRRQLPDPSTSVMEWKVVIHTRGFSGTEFSTGAFLPAALAKGYAFAASDEGWNRVTIKDQLEDTYYESRQRLVELTLYMKEA